MIILNIENYIEMQYCELQSDINIEYQDLYHNIEHDKLREILSTLHSIFISTYKTMNDRLPTNEDTAHFWADPSRELLRAIDISTGLQRTLKDSKFAFDFDSYYADLIEKSQKFLKKSGGSEIPSNMEKVELYYSLPIFTLVDSVTVERSSDVKTFSLRLVGEGSYAKVFKYQDSFYQTWFALKRAKKELNDKEVARFKQEFEEMQRLNSPYIVKVYRYDEMANEYIMEFMDCTLERYIRQNNNKMDIVQRKGIVNQVLRAFQYIHSKGRLHRDISHNNILLKLYDDVPVVKIADFGLVKRPDSTLTTAGTEFKGSFNDPTLRLEGFQNYSMVHETYALTLLVYFIMTGKLNTEEIKNSSLKEFVKKGMFLDKEKRYQSVDEMIKCFRKLNYIG